MKMAGQRGSPAVAAAAAAVVVVLVLVHAGEAVTIMSIDFGSEWMKVAVVAPGVPMEIALNTESKRKTPLAIAFRNGERTFGEDALTNGVRAPSCNYFYLLDLLGKKAEGNPVVEVFKRRFPHYNIEADPDRGTVVFRHDGNTTFTVEELVGQLLGHARDIATAHTDQRIKDCVITVPPFFNQAERRALLAAAQMTGLKVLSLMSSNAAVALNHGMFRRKEVNGTAQYILFYDMGASSTTATIVAYQTIKTKDKGYSETNPQVTVLGVGYDRLLGGLEMQLRLREHLARKFEEGKKTPNSVYESPRAMAKLLKEAGRVAKVLSANSYTLSQVEGVLDEEDFHLPIKREEFEEMCAEIFTRVRAPVDSALVSAGMDITAIDQFIIVGGATRIPRVQAILQEVWGRELGKNINADEAAAMGAVYRAADLGQGFKVKKFHVKEAVLFPVEVDFERKVEPSDPSGGAAAAPTTKVVKRSLFALGNNYPQKKVMTFNKHTSDFTFAVNYGENEHLPKPELRMAAVNNLSTIEVLGVTDAFKKHLGEGAEPKGIKAHFRLDDSGVLGLLGMEAVFEQSMEVEEAEAAGGAAAGADEESTLSRLGSTISKLFSGAEEEGEEEKKEARGGGGEKQQTKEERGEEEEKEKEAKRKEERKQEEKKEDEGGKKEDKKVKRSQVTIKEELNFTVTFLDLPNITPEGLKASQKKLEDIGAQEKVRHEREAARNTLESYILEAQDKLWQEEYEQASTDLQRERVRELCAQLDEWIYEEGAEQEADVYRAKLGQLSEVFEPIKRRVQEHHDRPEAVQALQDMVNGSSVFLQKAKQVPQENQLFTEVEMSSLQDLIQNTKEWLQEKVKLQDARSPHEDPVLTLSDVAEKWTAMDREIKYLVNKAKIVKAKKDREAAEAKLKAERQAKEEEKAGRRKNTTTTTEQQEGKEQQEQQQQEEIIMPGGDGDAGAPEEKKEEEEKGGERKEEEDDDPLNIFQEAREENNSEGDRRKGEQEEEEEEEEVGGDEEEEIKEDDDDDEKGPIGGGGGGSDGGGGGSDSNRKDQTHTEL